MNSKGTEALKIFLHPGKMIFKEVICFIFTKKLNNSKV